MKCYRVWYSNGAAILVDAENKPEAKDKGEKQAIRENASSIRVVYIQELRASRARRGVR